jgi:hypothetical protein
MKEKRRLSASVDASVLAAAQAAVSEGRAANVSAWVNEALHRQAAHDSRMRALDSFILSYEAKHGVIAHEEIEQAAHRLRERAIVVRGKKSGPKPRKTGRRGTRAA